MINEYWLFLFLTYVPLDFHMDIANCCWATGNGGSGFKQILNNCVITEYQGCIFSFVISEVP